MMLLSLVIPRRLKQKSRSGGPVWACVVAIFAADMSARLFVEDIDKHLNRDSLGSSIPLTLASFEKRLSSVHSRLFNVS